MSWSARLEEAERRLRDLESGGQASEMAVFALQQTLREAEMDAMLYPEASGQTIFGVGGQQVSPPVYTNWYVHSRWGRTGPFSSTGYAEQPFAANGSVLRPHSANPLTQHTSILRGPVSYQFMTQANGIGTAFPRFSVGAWIYNTQASWLTQFYNGTFYYGYSGTLNGSIWPVIGTPVNEGTQAVAAAVPLLITVAGTWSRWDRVLTFDFSATSAVSWAFQGGSAIVTIEVS